MKLPDLLRWWKGQPKGRRIALIACLLLVLSGPEMLSFLSTAYEIAALIDAMGLAFLVSLTIATLPALPSGLLAGLRGISIQGFWWARSGFAELDSALRGPGGSLIVGRLLGHTRIALCWLCYGWLLLHLKLA